MGMMKLKGLENPEVIYLMYPHSLSGRLIAQQQQQQQQEKQQQQHKNITTAAASIEPASLAQGESKELDTQYVWDAWNISLRLEMICSALGSPGTVGLKPPERSVLERMKNRGGEVTERFLVSLLEHQITRIEVSATRSDKQAMFSANLVHDRLVYLLWQLETWLHRLSKGGFLIMLAQWMIYLTASLHRWRSSRL